MLRRSLRGSPCARGAFASPVATARPFAALRCGGGSGKRAALDHSASFTHELEPELAAKVAAQTNRTVPSFVPGKLFMRHWIAGVQASESIVNRIMSLAVTFAVVVYGAVYATGGGLQGLSAAPFVAFAFFGVFIFYHTHVPWHAAALFGLYLVATYFGALA